MSVSWLWMPLSRRFDRASCSDYMIGNIRMLSMCPGVQERLQKCYEKSPAEPAEGGEIDPALLLRTLQVGVYDCQSLRG